MGQTQTASGDPPGLPEEGPPQVERVVEHGAAAAGEAGKDEEEEEAGGGRHVVGSGHRKKMASPAGLPDSAEGGEIGPQQRTLTGDRLFTTKCSGTMSDKSKS